MQSRRDQIHSYQFFMHRVVSGFVARETDPVELPFRRLGGAALGSVMVAALVLAAVGVYGLLSGRGATSWRAGDAVIVEKESGTRYVFRDGRLHPVANFVSARLLLEREAAVQTVSRASLEGVPRGPALGILGAPDGIPGSDRLRQGAWTLCSRIARDRSGEPVASSVLGVGRTAAGGAGLGDGAALVREANAAGRGTLHLVWNGHRYEIAEPDIVLVALGAGEDRVLDVDAAWLNGLPPGERIAPPRVRDRGVPSTAVGRRAIDPALRAGQVLEAAGSFYLAHVDELEPITELEAALVLADPDTADAYRRLDGVKARRVDPAVVVDAVRSTPSQPTVTQPPAHGIPHVVMPSPQDHTDGAICATYDRGQFAPSVLVGARLPRTGTAMATPGRTDQGALLASRVLVEPGRAALIEALPSPDATAGPLHLVTDLGVRHSVPDRAVARMLGYGAVRPTRMPAGLVARIPAGPALDPAAARTPVSNAMGRQGGSAQVGADGRMP